jgi:hypothetical protein
MTRAHVDELAVHIHSAVNERKRLAKCTLERAFEERRRASRIRESLLFAQFPTWNVRWDSPSELARQLPDAMTACNILSYTSMAKTPIVRIPQLCVIEWRVRMLSKLCDTVSLQLVECLIKPRTWPRYEVGSIFNQSLVFFEDGAVLQFAKWLHGMRYEEIHLAVASPEEATSRLSPGTIFLTVRIEWPFGSLTTRHGLSLNKLVFYIAHLRACGAKNLPTFKTEGGEDHDAFLKRVESNANAVLKAAFNVNMNIVFALVGMKKQLEVVFERGCFEGRSD